MRSLVFLLVACAHPTTTVVATTHPPAPSDPGLFCSRDDVILGPVTVGASWGPNHHTACRTGPSPVASAHSAIHDDALLQDCLRIGTVTDLEVELEIDRTGAVDRTRVVAISPPNADVRSCIDRMGKMQMMALGCRWTVRERW